VRRLILEITTIRGDPVPGRVSATAEMRGAGGGTLTLTSRSAREFGAELPQSGTFELVVSAEAAPDFWPARGVCFLSLPPEPQRISVTLSSGSAGDVADATIEGTGTDRVIRVRLPVARLADVTAEGGVGFGSPRPAMQWTGEPMTDPAGSGAGVLRGAVAPTTVLPANLIVGRWRSSGIRMAIYLPRAARTAPGHVNIFAKPPRSGGWQALGIIGFYCVWGEPGDPAPKHLVGQTEAGGSPHILVMPTPEDGTSLTYGNTQAGLLDLAEEVDVLVRRRLLGETGPRPALRSIALSCFSRGATAWAAVLGGARHPAFLDRLRGFWLLDGHLDDGYDAFAARVLAWQRGGADRTVRCYSTEGKFAALMAGAGKRTAGPKGAWEWRSDATVPGGFAAVSYHFLPPALWEEWNATAARAPGPHQLVPNLCMSHALGTSGVRPAP
jgi:hypothetical protein